MKWRTETVTVFWNDRQGIQVGSAMYMGHEFTATMKVVNSFWVTFRVELPLGASNELSVPLDRLTLSWDDKEKRPKILAD